MVFCVLADDSDQNNGVIKLNSLDGNTIEMQQTCLSMCHAYKGATGCEVIWNQENRGCYIHTKNVAKGNSAINHTCWVFSKCKGTSLIFSS